MQMLTVRPGIVIDHSKMNCDPSLFGYLTHVDAPYVIFKSLDGHYWLL